MPEDLFNDKITLIKKLAESIELLLAGLKDISEGKRGETERLISSLDNKIAQMADTISSLETIAEKALSAEEKNQLRDISTLYQELLKKYSKINLVIADKISELKSKTILQKKRIDIKKSYGV